MSSSYPGLITIQRIFHGLPNLLPGKSLPYEIPGDTSRVIYYEFRGRGTPPADVGRPGDVYWDVTFPYIIYVVGIDGWEAWNPQASAGVQLLARHPNFDDRYLWTSGDGFSWLTTKDLENSLVPVKTTVPQAFDQDLLTALLHCSPTTSTLALDLSYNQMRNNAEVQRRRLNGVQKTFLVPVHLSEHLQILRPCIFAPTQKKGKKERLRSVKKTPPANVVSLILDKIKDGVTGVGMISGKATEAMRIVEDLKGKYEEESAFAARIRSELKGRAEILAAEVEMLKRDNCNLKGLLDDSQRQVEDTKKPTINQLKTPKDNAKPPNLNGITFRDLRRKYAEDLKSAAEIYELRLAHADKRIKKLEQDAESASNRELELRERLKTVCRAAQTTIDSLTDKMFDKEIELAKCLPLLAASVKEISDDLEEYMDVERML
ncbi:hypothetical protein MVEN_02455600 [Mycena venus]|uniref:Uncharacterized protein n=1 Tax=Mycena venus TaxID=2733690 RepID=A0A8H6WWZ1_9AGAR|nr:hypothetical protein MVEN_02455600 [Mycena venus]